MLTFFFRCTAVILEYVIALLLRLAVCINSIGFVLLLLLYLLFVIFVLRGKLEFIQFEIEIGSLVVNVSASAVFGYLLLNESIFFLLSHSNSFCRVYGPVFVVWLIHFSPKVICVCGAAFYFAHIFFLNILISWDLRFAISAVIICAQCFVTATLDSYANLPKRALAKIGTVVVVAIVRHLSFAV